MTSCGVLLLLLLLLLFFLAIAKLKLHETLSPIGLWWKWKANYLKGNNPIGDAPIFDWTMSMGGSVNDGKLILIPFKLKTMAVEP